jgi:hypothetical protein
MRFGHLLDWGGVGRGLLFGELVVIGRRVRNSVADWVCG